MMKTKVKRRRKKTLPSSHLFFSSTTVPGPTILYVCVYLGARFNPHSFSLFWPFHLLFSFLLLHFWEFFLLVMEQLPKDHRGSAPHTRLESQIVVVYMCKGKRRRRRRKTSRGPETKSRFKQVDTYMQKTKNKKFLL